MKKLLLKLFIFLLLMGCVFDGGGSTETGGFDQNGGISGTGGPQIPPTESVGVVDIPSASRKKLWKKYASTTYYDHANELYRLIDSRIFLGMKGHASLYSELNNLSPTYEKDGRFHWRYDVSNVGDIVKVDFQGLDNNVNYEWFLKVINIQNFEACILEGVSNVKNNSGSWELKKLIDDVVGESFIKISWSKQDALIVVNYLVTEQGEHLNDTLHLEIAGKLISMVYVDASDNKKITINWDSVEHSGSVIDESFFDGEEKFWDSNLANLFDSDAF